MTMHEAILNKIDEAKDLVNDIFYLHKGIAFRYVDFRKDASVRGKHTCDAGGMSVFENAAVKNETANAIH